VACQHDGELCDIVLELLDPQFKVHHLVNEDRPPFLIEDLIHLNVRQDKAVLTEPLDHLLACLSKLVCELDRKKSPLMGASSIPDQLLTSARRLGKSELEDFALDKSTDFNTSEPEGILSTARAQLLHGVLEVLMAHMFTTRHMSHDDGMLEVGTTILGLFKKHEALSAAVAASGKGGKGQKSSKVTLQSSLGLSTVAELFRVLLSIDKADDVTGLRLLRSSTSFVQFVLKTATAYLGKAVQANAKGQPSEAVVTKALSASTTYECAKKIAVAAVAECARDVATSIIRAADVKEEGKKADGKEKSAKAACLEAFQAAVAVVCRSFPSQLKDLLSEAGRHVTLAGEQEAEGDAGAEDEKATTNKMCKWMGEQLSESLEQESFREASILVAVIADVIQCGQDGYVFAFFFIWGLFSLWRLPLVSLGAAAPTAW